MSNTKNQRRNYKSIPVEKLVFNKKHALSSSRFNAVDADISFEFAKINIILGDTGTGKTELLKHIHTVVNSQVPLDYADIFFGDNIKNKQVSSTAYPFSKFLPASDMTSRYDIELLKTLIERTNEKTKQSQKSQKTSVVRDLIEITFAQQAFIDLLISLKFYEVNHKNFDVIKNTIMLFDLPETGLHPKQIRLMTHVLFELVNRDVINQLFVTTHSLFLMREFELLNAAQKQRLSKRFISLDNNQIEQGNDLSDLNNVSILDENLAQADRYLNLQ